MPFIVNDDLDVALACGADGVHVGQDDMPAAEVRRRAGRRLIVGVSAHTPEEARLAEAAGADYLGAGAVFGSATKTDASLLTPAGLQAVCAAVHIPVVAIGGVNAGNILQLQGSGAAGAAVVSGIFGAPDITRRLPGAARPGGHHGAGRPALPKGALMNTALTIAAAIPAAAPASRPTSRP